MSQPIGGHLVDGDHHGVGLHGAGVVVVEPVAQPVSELAKIAVVDESDGLPYLGQVKDSVGRVRKVEYQSLAATFLV